MAALAFVCAPEGNGCVEWFIRVLKENLLWPRTFKNIEELRYALVKFKDFYNHHWMMGKNGNKTLAAVWAERSAQLPNVAR